MSVTVTWTPTEFVADVREAVAAGLTAGATVLAQEMTANIGSEGGKPLGRTNKVSFTTRSGQVVSFKTKKRFSLFESAPPGAFPGNRTGQLRRSIMHTTATANRLVASAGSAAAKGRDGESPDRYGLWLEYGTSKMEPRPWILRSFNRAKDKVFDRMATVAKQKFESMTDRRGGA